ncbi:MAG: glycosyltransferase [Candidatus Nitrospinota bacterium M3_3B_026]
MAEPPFVSVIVPVRNGEGRLENLLRSLDGQDYPRDRYEVIVADGRSEDRTVEIAKSFGAKVVDNPKRVQGAGRNLAIAAARGDIIAFSEDDCVLPPGWIRAGVEHLMREPDVAGLGGPTPPPDSAGTFALAVNFVFMMASGAGYSVQSAKVNGTEAEDLPGCNSMYKRRILENYLPTREGLAEDVELNFRMRRAGERLLFVPEFFAWHRKRETPRSFYRQIRRFGIGRARLEGIHPGVVRPLHWAAALAAPAAVVLVAALAAAGFVWAVFTALVVFFLLAALMSLRSGESGAVSMMAPLALVIFAVAWSAGFLAEKFFPGKPKP